MRFSIISALTLASMVAAMPREGSMIKREESSDATVQKAASAVGGNKVKDQPETSECIAPTLCCSSLTTPLDHIVDPVLKLLGVDAASIVGSVGLLCMLSKGVSYELY